MKRFLIILIALSLTGGLISVFSGISFRGNTAIIQILLFVCLLLVNVLCSRYLYKRSSIHKTEWALFGFLGNINALLIFWIVNEAVPNWKKGKSFFS